MCGASRVWSIVAMARERESYFASNQWEGAKQWETSSWVLETELERRRRGSTTTGRGFESQWKQKHPWLENDLGHR